MYNSKCKSMSLDKFQNYNYCLRVLILLFDIANIAREVMLLLWLNHIVPSLKP